MFRINPLARHTLKASRASLLSQQTRSLRIDVDNFFNPEEYVPPNMTEYRQRISDHAKSVVYKWEIRGRRNNETVDSLLEAVKDSYKKTAPYKLTPELKGMITEYFGYSEEEIDIAQDFDHYMNVMYQEDGTPNWEKWKEHIGQGSSALVDAISKMQETNANLKKRAAKRYPPDEIKKKQWELHNIDFSYFEGKIPSKTLNQVIGMYKALVEKYEPDLDTNEINRLHVEQLNRAMNEIVDELGVMKRSFVDIPTEKIVHYGPMFQTDENGVPVWDFNSFAFIDRFFPEIRDVVLREMAVENYRMEYPVEHKKYATTYDDTISKIHKHAVEQRLKELESRSGTVKIGGNKRQMELARALQNVSDLLEEASALAREAQSNKGEEETSTSEKRQKAKETEEEVVKTTTKEEDEFVWTAIEEQTGMTRAQMFGGRSGDYEPIDINQMLDEEEAAAKNK